MNISEAYRICHRYFTLDRSAAEKEFPAYCDAAEYLIEKTGDPDVLCGMGAAYYERSDYDMALRYYEEAAAKGNTDACLGLGYIWYYGRTGERDYKKAFEYFSMAPGNINAEYKLADMYRTGKYVRKDEQRYREKIEKIYALLRETEESAFVPEICARLAHIWIEQGKKDEALELLRKAEKALSCRMEEERFFGNFSIMKGIIEDKYALVPFDEKNFGLYDLYFLLKSPCTVTFSCKSSADRHTVCSAEGEDGSAFVRFGEKRYRSADDFLRNAEIGGVPLSALYRRLENFTLTQKG